jgi:glycosyltransferase involved in cell wall biosynthesis
MHPEIQLTIVGKGSREADVKRMVKSMGLSGKVIMKSVAYEKIANEYRNADIFFAPSKKDSYWVEQFGMVFLEAMASGLPIVSTKSGAIPEVVGDTALLADEGDTNSMSNYLLSLISNLKMRKKMGEKARKRAVEEASIQVIAKKIDEVYQNIL